MGASYIKVPSSPTLLLRVNSQVTDVERNFVTGVTYLLATEKGSYCPKGGYIAINTPMAKTVIKTLSAYTEAY